MRVKYGKKMEKLRTDISIPYELNYEIHLKDYLKSVHILSMQYFSKLRIVSTTL